MKQKFIYPAITRSLKEQAYCAQFWNVTNKFEIMETLIVLPPNEDKLKVVKAFLKAIDVEFEKSPYDPEFVAKIKEGEKQFREGRGFKKDISSLWK